MMLTILTPTYNRAEELKRLGDSLLAQTSKDFEWLVIDDGSSDETAAVVNDFSSQASFPVRYVKKDNGGKHTAINLGVSMISSGLTFIVDSDDWLTEDAVSTIFDVHSHYKNREDVCGYSFLRAFPDGTINGSRFERDGLIGSYIDVRVNSDDTGADKAEVFRTQCLREFPFPEFPGEHFLGEDLVWVRMGRKYDMVHVNKAIYIGDYLDDGLTNNRRINNISSPHGCMMRASEFMKPDLRLRYRIKGAIQYLVYGMFADSSISKLIGRSEFKWLSLVCLFPALMIHASWRRQYVSASQ